MVALEGGPSPLTACVPRHLCGVGAVLSTGGLFSSIFRFCALHASNARPVAMTDNVSTCSLQGKIVPS